MIVGVPKEIKVQEDRVALTPAGAHQLVGRDHRVLVESGAGEGCSLPDAEYEEAGAQIVQTAQAVYEEAELIIKVKEPQPSEFDFLGESHVLFTYLHLAAEPEVTRQLLSRKVTAIGYEAVELSDGQLPLLIPMSEVAGKMAIQEGAKYLESIRGGRGVLLGGVPGVQPGVVTILGGGIVGMNAAKVALGLGAQVYVLDISLPRLRYLDDTLHGVTTLIYSPHELRRLLPLTDLLVGAVLVRAARTPRLITRDMLRFMKSGAVIVDVAIDQGGCCESSHPTTHTEPTFLEEGIVHYCVTNMPGAVAHTSTFALTGATFPYIQKLADKGVRRAIAEDRALFKGVNTYKGYLVTNAVADALGLPWKPLSDLLPETRGD